MTAEDAMRFPPVSFCLLRLLVAQKTLDREFPMYGRGLRTIVALALSVIPTVAYSQLYDNGAPSALGGSEITNRIVSDDFSLTQRSVLTGFRFWAFSFGELSDTYEGSIAWRIYASGAGVPDYNNIVFGGLAVVSPTDEGPTSLARRTRFRFDVATDIMLGAGSYWLGLHNGDYSVTENQTFFWETTTSNSSSPGVSDDAPFDEGGWSLGPSHLAFQISGRPSAAVPEPSSWPLLACGLICIAAACFSRRFSN